MSTENMSIQAPTVSVCIPTYNRAEMLREAIKSVLAQTYQDFEVIVSDNASKDHTESVVQTFHDWRIRYIRNARNEGLRKNYLRCLALSRGKYITILSDDDQMMRQNLETKVEVLSKNPDVGLVHSKFHVIDRKGDVIRQNTNWCHGPDRTNDALERGRDVLTSMLLTSNLINTPTVLFRRECYERLGEFTNHLKLAWDWEYWMRIAVYYNIAFIAQPLIKWGFHEGSQTSQHLIDTDNRITTLNWKELLVAKRLIIKDHFNELDRPYALKAHVWAEMSSQTVEIAQSMLANGRPKSDVRAFIQEMCCALPEILLDQSVWKVFFKTVLGPKSIALLKRIAPL